MLSPNKSSNLGVILGPSNMVVLTDFLKGSVRTLQPWLFENCLCFYIYEPWHEID